MYSINVIMKNQVKQTKKQTFSFTIWTVCFAGAIFFWTHRSIVDRTMCLQHGAKNFI